MLDGIVRDIRYALRALRGRPGLTSVATLSLALGIGANTAIFSLIDAAMLKSLPVSRPAELLQVTMGPKDYLGYSNPIWEQIRNRQDVFAGIFAYGRWALDLSGGGEVHSVNGYLASGQLFDTLGVRAALGRTFTPADDYRGCPGTTVLSYAFWQREYGGRPDIVGKTISLNSHPFEVLGVSEPRFTGIDTGYSVDVMVPLCTEKILHGELNLLDSTFIPGWLRIVARPRPDVTAAQATARLKTLAPLIYRAAVPQAWPAAEQQRFLARTFDTEPAGNGMPFALARYREPLFILMAMVGLVLAIACANVANLLLARGAARQREIGIRTALGCGRSRLFRQLLTESLLLSVAGAALGVLFANWGTRLLTGYLDVFLDLTPDVRVLAFTSGIAILTGLLFGIAPAWRATRVQPQSAMRAGSRGIIGGSKSGIGKTLVALQVALSLVLLAGAGLLLSTFRRLASLDPGFDRGRVLLAALDLRNSGTPAERRPVVYQEILSRLRAIPGVRSAGMSSLIPICGCSWSAPLVIEGDTAGAPAGSTVSMNKVSGGYFETLGTPLLAGRDFDARDTPTSPAVAVINQTMAREFFGGANPLGRHFRLRKGDTIQAPIEVAGIVKDAKFASLREVVPPTAFIARSQDPKPSPLANFEIRAAGGPESLDGAVKAAVGAVNPHVSLEFTTLAIRVDQSLQREQLMAVLSAFFGGLALLLAMIGLYGVMSYNVARRRGEIGIRMALGAEPGRVRRMLLAEAALLVGIGVAAGLGAALAATRLVASLLYGLQPDDPLTLFLSTAVLASVGVLAAYWPALRASRMDPVAALREE